MSDLAFTAAEYERMAAATVISPEKLRADAVKQAFIESIPLPKGAVRLPSGGYALKQPDPQRDKPKIELPAFTPTVAKQLGEMLQRAHVREAMQRRLLTRQRKPFHVALTKLLEEAEKRGGWVWRQSAEHFGERLGKSGEAARKTLTRLDTWEIIGYRHPPRTDGGATARMVIDLRPLVKWLWVICCEELETNKQKQVSNSSQQKKSHAPRGYVLRMYTGNAKIVKQDGSELVTGDVSAYMSYRHAIERRQLTGINAPLIPLVLARHLNVSALFALDALLQIEGGTVREVEEEAGMSNLRPGLNILAQLGLVDVEVLPQRGNPKYYQLRPDWQARLHRLLPDMIGYGAADRLLIRNLTRNFDNLDLRIKRKDATPQQIEELGARRDVVAAKLRKVKAQAALRGTYGRPRMEWRV